MNGNRIQTQIFNIDLGVYEMRKEAKMELKRQQQDLERAAKYLMTGQTGWAREYAKKSISHETKKKSYLTGARVLNDLLHNIQDKAKTDKGITKEDEAYLNQLDEAVRSLDLKYSLETSKRLHEKIFPPRRSRRDSEDKKPDQEEEDPTEAINDRVSKLLLDLEKENGGKFKESVPLVEIPRLVRLARKNKVKKGYNSASLVSTQSLNVESEDTTSLAVQRRLLRARKRR